MRRSPVRTVRLGALVRLLLVWAAAAAAACGYSLAGRGSFLPSYITTVAIPPLENRTAVARAEQVLTERIRNEFIGRGKYTVVSDPAGADAVLRAEIADIRFEPAGLNEQQLQSRTRVTLVMRVSFEDLRAGEVLWANDSLVVREEYEVSFGGIDGASFVSQQGSSFERLADNVARTVVTSILEAF